MWLPMDSPSTLTSLTLSQRTKKYKWELHKSLRKKTNKQAHTHATNHTIVFVQRKCWTRLFSFFNLHNNFDFLSFFIEIENKKTNKPCCCVHFCFVLIIIMSLMLILFLFLLVMPENRIFFFHVFGLLCSYELSMYSSFLFHKFSFFFSI